MFIPKALLLLAASPLCLGSSLPIVDLGYELHQAISLNVWPLSIDRAV